MKAKTVVKVILDIIMIVLFPILLFAYATGLAFHEIAGLVLVFIFLLHLILNGKWIKGSTKQIFTGKSTTKLKYTYILNSAILLGALTIAVTGFMISGVVIGVSQLNLTAALIHKWASYITGLLLLAHVVLHAKYLAFGIKKLFASLFSTTKRRALSTGTATIMVALIVYSSLSVASAGKDLDNQKMESLTNSSSEVSMPLESAAPKKREEHIPESSSNSSMYEPKKAEIIEDEAEKKAEEIESETKEEISEPVAEEPVEEAISLNEFLGKMFCTSCSRHCPLSNPSCRKSSGQIESATAEYYSIYGITE